MVPRAVIALTLAATSLMLLMNAFGSTEQQANSTFNHEWIESLLSNINNPAQMTAHAQFPANDEIRVAS
jgi:hypothetical protein